MLTCCKSRTCPDYSPPLRQRCHTCMVENSSGSFWTPRSRKEKKLVVFGIPGIRLHRSVEIAKVLMVTAIKVFIVLVVVDVVDVLVVTLLLSSGHPPEDVGRQTSWTRHTRARRNVEGRRRHSGLAPTASGQGQPVGADRTGSVKPCKTGSAVRFFTFFKFAGRYAYVPGGPGGPMSPFRPLLPRSPWNNNLAILIYDNILIIVMHHN